MAQTTDIIIPWRPSGDWWRESSFNYVSRHMEPLHPLYVDDGSEPFSRSGSKNLGAETSKADVIMFLDADTVIPHEQILEAFEIAKQGYFVYPFNNYHSMSSHTSKLIFRGELEPAPEHSEWCIGWATGGAMAMPRDLFYQMGAFDEGFIDWGMEDAALLIMANKAGIEVKKVEGNCYHLWHPRAQENENILNNYKKYRTEYLGE